MTRRRLTRSLGLGALGIATAPLLGCGERPRSTGARRVRYGDDDAQFVELTVPEGAGTFPVAVVIHGGFWLDRYGIDLATPLAADLASHGVAALALEYRRVGGGGGGGWPTTDEDVVAGVRLLGGDALGVGADLLDLDRVVFVGHSAGAQLAVVAAHAHPVRVAGVVAQAGVLDLAAAYDDGLGNGAVESYVGATPGTDPAAYRAASPIELLPLGLPIRLVHGDSDTTVPIDQSERFLAAGVEAGDDVELTRVPGADHFDVIDPDHAAWAACRSHVLDLVGR